MRRLCSVLLALLMSGCVSPSQQAKLDDLDRRYLAIAGRVQEPGARAVLDTARQGLRENILDGDRSDLVGIEDLWTHALQEGAVLFEDEHRRWNVTGAAETGDMLGQATIGPWQLTLDNIRNTYGEPYGIQSHWDNKQLVTYFRNRPVLQARMIADYIQDSYETHGKRTPYALQRYFWLDAFVNKQIGLAEWDAPVVARPPRKMTDTGFYAKQILLGHSHQPRGLLYWLLVTADEAEVRRILAAWKTETELPDRKPESAGRFAVQVGELKYVPEPQRAMLTELVGSR
jgi:hypothetical protein